MRSLEEPALIAELRSFQKKIIQSDPVKRTNFPGLSVERRHVIV
jgi:exopolyphosphatase/pppGpp-phosphohydrolase